jgi:hypothetical protein
MNIVIILIVICIAPAFWIYGKRIFGAQTHPAAIFILAWMASSFLLGAAVPPNTPTGIISFVWVLVCSVVYAIIKKLRAKASNGQKSDQS